MASGKLIRNLFTSVCLVTLTGLPMGTAFADWRSSRDAAMTQRESGQAADAYQSVVSAPASKAKEVTDRHFLAGFLSLRTLGRADIAVQHFQAMAVSIPNLSSGERTNARAMAGYWLGRALSAMGKNQEAQQMYLAAAGYRDTFYGQMAASQAGLQDTTTVMSHYAEHYPDMDIFWHDPRVRKELVLAIIRAESSFRENAVSPAGAKGLMQVMDGTALRIGELAGVDIDLSLVAKNGNYNVAVGSKFLGDLLTRYNGNVLLAAAAYNAGQGKADEWIRRFGDPRSGAIDPVDWIELIPYAETREYVKRVVSNYIVYIGLAPSR